MTRAAEELHLTQSAVSAAIAALEERHSVKLFDRIGRHLELSEAGKIFLPEALEILNSARRAAFTLDDLANLRRGQITVAGSQTVFNYWLPVQAARFSERYPAITLNLISGNTAQVAQAVLNGQAEIGIVEGIVDDRRLARKKVAADRIAIYAARNSPLSQRTIRKSDLTGAKWILREGGSGTRAHFEKSMLEKGINPATLNIFMTLPSNEAALAAIKGSAALTAVSELAAAPHLTAGLISRLKFELPERTFESITVKERSHSRAIMAFLTMIE